MGINHICFSYFTHWKNPSSTSSMNALPVPACPRDDLWTWVHTCYIQWYTCYIQRYTRVTFRKTSWACNGHKLHNSPNLSTVSNIGYGLMCDVSPYIHCTAPKLCWTHPNHPKNIPHLAHIQLQILATITSPGCIQYHFKLNRDSPGAPRFDVWRTSTPDNASFSQNSPTLYWKQQSKVRNLRHLDPIKMRPKLSSKHSDRINEI